MQPDAALPPPTTTTSAVSVSVIVLSAIVRGPLAPGAVWASREGAVYYLAGQVQEGTNERSGSRGKSIRVRASSGVGANGDRLHAREEPDHDDRPNDASRQGQRPRRPAYRVFSGAREGRCGPLHHRAAGRPQAEQGVVLRRMFGVGEARHPPIRQARRRGARARRAAVHPALRLRRARQGHDDHGRVAPALGCLQDALDRAPRDPDGHGAGACRRRGQGIRGVGSQRKGRRL